MEQAQVQTSIHHFAETVDRLADAIAASGATLFARLDQREAAHMAGLDLRPTVLLVFGNPRGGTPLMDAVPLVALDLPLKVLVWEERSVVFVAYAPMATIAARYDIAGHEAQLNAMQHAMEAIVSHVI
jgi:uncharacterized protein (DUF302 family)